MMYYFVNFMSLFACLLIVNIQSGPIKSEALIHLLISETTLDEYLVMFGYLWLQFRLSVICLYPTQPVEILGSVSVQYCTLAIR